MSIVWLPYTLPVQKAWRKPLGLGPKRHGCLVRLADGVGHVGWGEAAPLAAVHGAARDRWVLGRVLGPARRTPGIDRLVGTYDGKRFKFPWQDLPWARHPAVRFALEMAAAQLEAARRGTRPAALWSDAPRPRIAVAALLAAGDDAVERFLARDDLADVVEIKVKVGRRAAAGETRALQRLVAALPTHVGVRLDANRAWSLAEAGERLAKLDPARFAFVEEPLADPSELGALHRRTGHRFALDETLVEAVGESLRAAPYVVAWVLKPMALGLAGTFELATAASSRGVRPIVSSCLESGLGLAFLAEIAMALPGHEGAAGLGTARVYRRDPLAATPCEGAWIEAAKGPLAPPAAWAATPEIARELLGRARWAESPSVMAESESAAARTPTPVPVGVAARRFVVGYAQSDPAALAHALARALRRDGELVPLLIDSRLPLAMRERLLDVAGAAACVDDRGTVVRAGAVGYPCSRTALLLATSGSTGLPRLVAYSWPGLVAAAVGAVDRLDSLRTGDRWLLALGLHHVAGLAIVHRVGLVEGTVVVPPRGKPLAEALADANVQAVSLVPTQAKRLLAHPAGRRELAALGTVLIGGAPVDAALRAALLEHEIQAVIGYGSTETMAFVAAGSGEEILRRPNAVGALLPGREARIDAQGAIHLRSPSLALGYVTSPGTLPTPLVDDEGWFATGDRGHIEDGFLHVVGRVDRVFQCGGENVQPEAIEAAILGLDGVGAAAVLPQPDPEWGARPIAFVRGSALPAASALGAWARERLAPWLVPVAWYRLPAGGDDAKPALAALAGLVGRGEAEPLP